MNYLLTGAAGFIGSHLAVNLLKDGNRVFAIDNFCDFYSLDKKRKNIEIIGKSSGRDDLFRLYEGDIRDSSFLKKTLGDILKTQVKSEDLTVIHIAAMPGVRPSLENPALYVDVNINGTLNMLEICREFGLKRFLFASSSSVYGNNKKAPFSEDDPAENPISVYAATKKAGELMCHTYSNLYDISVICLRYFTVYGARQRPDLAIYRFTDLLSKGRPITVFGDGSSRRDYTYIDDIIDGTRKAVVRLENDRPAFEIYNLGESRTVELSYLIKLIEKELGKKANMVRKPGQPGDMAITYADISRAKEVLGYNPKTDIEDGIKLFVRWYKESETS
ncbi:MAG: GDP-mannose 4,6-dehydratase [Candidatus Eremiobacteraeota bacterium]|nr:GDP-mannose 4,6-dehydratase [Candidatus Eremiobacteraeota bacterium]